MGSPLALWIYDLPHRYRSARLLPARGCVRRRFAPDRQPLASLAVSPGTASRRSTLEGMKTFSLRSVKLRSGEEYRDAIKLELTPFEYGGQRYLPVPNEVPAEFAVTRASTGTVFSLAFAARL